MRIRLLRNLGRELPRYYEGQVVEANEREAEMLIARGLAEPTDDPIGMANDSAPPEPAVGSVEQATEDLKKYRDRQLKRPSAIAAPATPATIGKNPHATE